MGDLAAIDPREEMQAVMGEDASTYNAPVGCFLPGSEYANGAGMDRVGGQRNDDALRAIVTTSGYGGEKVVLLHPTDQPFYDAMDQVCAATLKRIGVNVDDATMDWGTVVQRRNSKGSLDKAGWWLFCTSFPALDYTNPLAAPGLRGTSGKAWYGWPVDEKIEAVRTAWIDIADEGERKRLAEEIQLEAFTAAMYVPLGQYLQSAAWRAKVTGHLKGQPPLFWNVVKG